MDHNNNQPIIDLTRSSLSVLMDLMTCQLSWHRSIKAGAFWYLRRNYYHWWRCIKRSVFREGDRREAELCLYTGWIISLCLKRRFEWLSYYCYFCHCIGNLDLDCWCGASNPDCRGRFSWVDWQKIDIWPWDYNQSIEHNESFPKRHSLPSYDHYKPRYWGLGEFGRKGYCTGR